MSREERRGFDNGIWLCGGCSSKIDGDFSTYPKHTLHTWKADAEAKARRVQGLRPVANGLQDLLQQALSAQTQKSLPTSVSEALYSESRSMEALDPRFKVTPSWQHGVTSFEIVPTAPVKASWHFKLDAKEHYKSSLRSLIEHGQSFEFDAADVTIQGSPLLEKIFSEEKGRVVLTPRSIPASAQIVVRHNDLDITELLVELEGDLVNGSKSATFSGTALDGCLKLSVPINLAPAVRSCSIVLEASLVNWEGMRLAELPHLGRLLKLYQKLVSAPELHLIIAVNGQECWDVSFGSQQYTQYVRQTYNFLRVAAAARQISMAFNPAIRWSFNKLDEMSPAADMLEVQAILNGVTLETTMAPASLEFTTPERKSLQSMRMMSSEQEVDFTVVEPKGKVIWLLGVPCQLPRLQVEVGCAFVRLYGVREVGPGEYQGRFQVRAGKGFLMRRQFVD
ncbi:hypothetical protein [Pseudomonas sp. LG1E9]|uniref:hypothetical protein n=1 Tax=Pseudomonas sp. LG1E9 TaxID=2219057 RepID=UPI0013A6A6C1|nr:hypothetical protein [Pseudomonas sp. LG1E9]